MQMIGARPPVLTWRIIVENKSVLSWNAHRQKKTMKEPKLSGKRRSNVRLNCYLGIAAVILFLNVLAWNSTAFCDAYIAHVFPLWVNTYGRITGLFSFSVGEGMIAAGVALLSAAALLLPVLAAAFIFHKDRWRTGLGRFYKFFAWVLLGVCLIMTLNCFILYHASTFSEKYFGADEGNYTLEELITFRNHVVEQCNRLSREIKRNNDGSVRYDGSLSAEGQYMDMEDKARETMANLGETYPQLEGWYPRPKALLSSDFMCQQYMQGYYFPFSMEANYNDVMEIMNKPATMCHELAHLRGYIYEDEANFISYLACTQSDDIYFQYSGYLSVLNYLDNDLYRAGHRNPQEYGNAVRAVRPLIAYETVRKDNVFVSDKEWERINTKALVDTETVDQVTDTLVDASLKVNGVEDGMVSYSRVVRLLLQYDTAQKKK